MYLFGLTYANGTGSLVSSDFKSSTTCCLRLGGIGSSEDKHLLYNSGPFGPVYASPSGELTDNVAMGRRKLFTREDVLDKAIPVFWKHGLAETSVQDLEHATGVRKSGLYTEFKDKEDLFVESLRRYFDVLMARGHLTKQPLGWTNVEFSQGLLWELGAEGLLLGELYARVRRPPPKSPPDHGRERNESPSVAHRQSSCSAWIS